MELDAKGQVSWLTRLCSNNHLLPQNSVEDENQSASQNLPWDITAQAILKKNDSTGKTQEKYLSELSIFPAFLVKGMKNSNYNSF